MKYKNFYIFVFAAAMLLISGCSNKEHKIIDKTGSELSSSINPNTSELSLSQSTVKEKEEKAQPAVDTDTIVFNYKDKAPKQWGERVPGIKTSLNTEEKVIALTFDACGGPQGNGYDEELINYLIEEKVPATLFINYRWIDANKDIFLTLSKNPLFEIENHGYGHRPLSVNGKSAYGIKGTKNIQEVVDEVLLNQKKIEELTGRKPKFFRPGTAYSDEVSVRIVKDLGEEVVGYNVLGDAGATYNRNQIKESCLKAKPGSIVLLHMNHPEKETFEGMKLVIPELRKLGFKFVKLSDYQLK